MSAPGPGYGRSAAYPALPRGRSLLKAEEIERYQRRRLVVALAELAHEEGLAGVTVSALVRRARISRKTFYDYFADREALIEAACVEAQRYLFAGLEEAAEIEPAEARVRAGVAALAKAITEEPLMAELAVVHAPGLSGTCGRRFEALAVEAIARLIEGGPGGESASEDELAASAIVGAIAWELRRGEVPPAEKLSELALRLAGAARVMAP